MPRPGPARVYVGVRLNPDGASVLRSYAERETNGNLSEIIRVLLAEAMQLRHEMRDK